MAENSIKREKLTQTEGTSNEVVKRSDYVSLSKTDETEAQYVWLVGQRSNGKTYAVCRRGLENYFNSDLKNPERMAVIRRWSEDFVGARSAATMFDSLVHNGKGENVVEQLSNGIYNGVQYWRGRYYLTYTDQEGAPHRSDEFIAYGFSISEEERYKSGSYTSCSTILFDEVVSRAQYLKDEFIKFCNLISTIIRDNDRWRKGVKIYMCANSVNMFCPYFEEMGIQYIRKQKQGTVDVYKYGDSGLRVAVYLCEKRAATKSSVYFAFDNPALRMITEGEWEIKPYPRIPSQIPNNGARFAFILYKEYKIKLVIVHDKENFYLAVIPKTTELRHEEKDILYGEGEHLASKYGVYNLLKDNTKFSKICRYLIGQGKVYYATNMIGEIFQNYLAECRK